MNDFTRVAMCLLTMLSGGAVAHAQDAPAPSAAPAAAMQTLSEEWRDRLDLFIGLDGSKQPQDLGINANIGPRVAMNAGVPLAPAAGVGLQLGAAVNVADAAVAVLERVDGTSRRTQIFTTVGLFQRRDRLQWSVVYDLVRQAYFDDTTLAQVRGEFMVAAGRRDRVGMWFTLPARSADATAANTPLRLAAIAQFNASARHAWSSGATTGVWVGVASGHHNVVLVFPENTRDRHVLVYGAELTMPLNDRWAVTGATNLITPSASGTVDAFMGVSVRLGGRASSRLSAGLPVANNTSFSVDLYRR